MLTRRLQCRGSRPPFGCSPPSTWLLSKAQRKAPIELCHSCYFPVEPAVLQTTLCRCEQSSQLLVRRPDNTTPLFKAAWSRTDSTYAAHTWIFCRNKHSCLRNGPAISVPIRILCSSSANNGSNKTSPIHSYECLLAHLKPGARRYRTRPNSGDARLAAASSFAAATRAGPSKAMRFSVNLTAGPAMLMTPIAG